jgi:hypothetical protein
MRVDVRVWRSFRFMRVLGVRIGVPTGACFLRSRPV